MLKWIVMTLPLSKEPVPILVTEAGITIEIKFEQPLKQLFSRLITESEIVMEVILEQSSKQEDPIVIIESGITMEDKTEQPIKQLSPKDVQLVPIVTLTN